MVNIEDFYITLKKQSGVYFAGETVHGIVSYRIRERIKVNCVFLLAEGQATVQWTEHHGTGKQRRSQTYKKHESYLKLKIILIGQQGNNDLYLEVGDHSQPFQVTIPSNAPTSFEHVHGKIRYSLMASIDIPWAFDKHAYRALTVVSHVDLNLNPALRQPYNTSESKTLCCLCCKSGPITATLHIKKTGYVCGEFLGATVTFDNQSSRDVKNPVMHLIEHIRLHAARKTKMVVRRVGSYALPNLIKAKSTERFDNVGFIVPAVCPTLTSSRIIQIGYHLDLNFDAAGPSVSSDMKVPLVIGTIPLGESRNVLSNQLSFQPNFFGAVTVRADQDQKGGDGEPIVQQFLPHYPFYKDFSINHNNQTKKY